uniref:TGFb_propeptide domain-containing protein n=1 Tax=Macrostomum lignano TaxID=282301 RepID=A0A1I8J7V1_9PLAT
MSFRSPVPLASHLHPNSFSPGHSDSELDTICDDEPEVVDRSYYYSAEASDIEYQDGDDLEEAGQLESSGVRRILHDWVEANNPKISSVNDLLKRMSEIHPELPADARTLMETPRDLNLKRVEPGHYFHFGIVK